jgi:hypothetical protein
MKTTLKLNTLKAIERDLWQKYLRVRFGESIPSDTIEIYKDFCVELEESETWQKMIK